MKRKEMFRRSSLYGDDLDDLDYSYGAFDTPEGVERLGKIAVITDYFASSADAMPGRHLPLYPVRRWRKSLDDLAEAISLAERGTFLSGRAVRKCEKRVADAEVNLDGYLDKIIKKYRLEEAWRALSSEGPDEFHRLLGRRDEGPTDADLNAQFDISCSMQDLMGALHLVTGGIKDSVSAATRFRAEGGTLSLATAGYDTDKNWRPWRGRSTTIRATVAVSGQAQVSAVLLGANVLPKVATMPKSGLAHVFLEPRDGMPFLVIEASDTRASIDKTPGDDDELFEYAGEDDPSATPPDSGLALSHSGTRPAASRPYGSSTSPGSSGSRKSDTRSACTITPRQRPRPKQ